MPQLAVAAASSLASTFAAGYATTAFAGTWFGTAIGSKVFGALIGGVLAMGLSAILRQNQKKSSVDDNNIMVDKVGTMSEINTIYGNTRVGTVRVYMESGTANGDTSGTEYLHIIFCLCEGPIEKVRNVYFGDEIAWSYDSSQHEDLPPDQATYFTTELLWLLLGQPEGNVVNYLGQTYQGRNGRIYGNVQGKYAEGDKPVVMGLYNGEQTTGQFGPGNTFMKSNNDFNNKHIGRNVSYGYVRLPFDDDMLGGLPRISADVSGSLIENVETGQIIPSNNPADVIWDYLTNTLYGYSVDISRLDRPSFIYTRNFCENASATVTQNTYNSNGNITGSETRTVYPYRVNGATRQSEDLFTNLQRIAANMNCWLMNVEGKIYLYPTDAPTFDSNTYNFNKSNILRKPTSFNYDSIDVRRNHLKLAYNNIELEGEPDYVVLNNENYLAEDDGIRLTEIIDLPFTNDRWHATAIGEQYMDESRNSVLVSFTGNLSSIVNLPWDPVTVTLEEQGWVEKKFRIISQTHNPDGMTFDYELLSYNEPKIKV